MPRAVVTGGRGLAGSRVVEHLADAGWEVVCVDLGLPDVDGPPGVSFRAGDLTEQGVAWELIADADPDAVVHFAAIPTDGNHAGSHVYDTNVASAYNVLDAAGRVGARVVWSSSVTAYGLFHADADLPDALPVDEATPLRPRRPYPASKVTGEVLAGLVARRYGVPVASLRLALVIAAGGVRSRRTREGFDLETASPGSGFGTYVDARDVASLVELALTGDLEGHEAFVAAAAENCLDVPTAEAVRAAYGRLPESCSLEGHDAFYSAAKAREVLGWEPTHDWRDVEAESLRTPAFADSHRTG
ncbi:MAG: NAD-dependent epimerase/dehydratase family protein [Halobacteriaceae archaeon]